MGVGVIGASAYYVCCISLYDIVQLHAWCVCVCMVNVYVLQHNVFMAVTL